MINFKTPDNFPKPIINEFKDRRNRKAEGTLPIDDDEAIVYKNDPRNKYVKPEDVADDSYLNYGEEVDDKELGDEENYMLTEEEIEKEARGKEADMRTKQLGQNKNYSKDHTSIIGEVAHSDDSKLSEDLSKNGEDEILDEKNLGIKSIYREMRAASARLDRGGFIKPDKNRDNLKTELPSKRKRRNRGLLRNFFKN